MEARAAVFAVAILAVFTVAADTQEDELAELLADEREQWSVAILQFTGVDLEVANEYLTSSIPRLLREDLRDIEEHRLSDETIRGYRRWIVEQARLEVGRRLTRARRERDDLLFDRLEPETYRRRYREETDEIEEIRALLHSVETVDLERIAVERRKAVRFVSDDLPTAADVAEFAEDEDVDLVIYGRVEQIEEYVYLEFFAWDRFRGEERSLGVTAARPEEIYDASADIQATVAQTILGRDWAHLIVEAPPGAAVSVDGSLRGVGTVEIRYLRTGDVRIGVRAPGKTSDQRVISLLPYRTTEIVVDLDDEQIDEIRVVSDPEDVDVYVQSVWQGRTPILLPRPRYPLDVTLTGEGYREDSFVLSPRSPDHVERVLVPQDRNWNVFIQRRRNVFYWSLGAFALSVPVPVVFGSLYDDARAQLEAYQSLAPVDEANELARRGNAYLYTRRIGMAAMIGLLANTLWQLSRYIRAAEYEAE